MGRKHHKLANYISNTDIIANVRLDCSGSEMTYIVNIIRLASLEIHTQKFIFIFKTKQNIRQNIEKFRSFLDFLSYFDNKKLPTG